MGKFLCANGVIFLIRAKRDINKDEELQWNYNGSLEEYDMSFGEKKEQKTHK